MKKSYIIISSLVACTILYSLEQALAVDYLTKTVAKLLLFTLIPYFHVRGIAAFNFKGHLYFGKSATSTFTPGLILGAASFLVIIAAYFLLKGHLDLAGIAQELQVKGKITPSNFIFVGLYIMFGNSFLEEFFFRGFIFLNLYQQGFRKFAYTYSSILFGLYHIAIIKTWFNPLLIMLALLGLMGIGFVLNWLDTKSGTIINSWLVHIMADSAIILIGLRMFELI
jgi:membrane protease YdiL (CAAX protease family)